MVQQKKEVLYFWKMQIDKRIVMAIVFKWFFKATEIKQLNY